MMIDTLVIIGALTTVVVIAFAMIVITDFIKESIRKLKLKYRQKHRFDKPPTAACYCIDCIYHDNKTGKCDKFERWHTADCWFCWNATPRKKECEQE